MRTIGAVPYLNARPLVRSLEDPVSGVRVIYDVPSRLPAMLDESRADAVLVSSIEALTRPNARIAPGVSISSLGEVLSVRLFSKVPPQEIRAVGLDASSMTSNLLAEIVLAEVYGIRPATSLSDSEPASTLRHCDAALLIGDCGMRTSAQGLYVIDLGAAWASMTGLPFVWALWVGGDRLDEDLAGCLVEARRRGEAGLDEIIAEEVDSGRWERSLCERYLREVMDYGLSEGHLEGLRLFGELATNLGTVEAVQWPSILEPAVLVGG